MISVFSAYRIVKPKHLIDSWQCTIALCACDSKWNEIDNEILIYDKRYNFGNKLVELQYGDDGISLLGIHMNPCEKMWDMVLESCKNKNKRHTFLVGDFNVYELRGAMQNKLQELRNLKYCSCIPTNVITAYKYKSSIDNIFIDNSLTLKGGVSIAVNGNVFFQTDHALCSIEITGEIEKKNCL